MKKTPYGMNYLLQVPNSYHNDLGDIWILEAMHASHHKGSVHSTSRFRANRAKLIMHTSDVQARGQEMILLSEHAIYDFPSSYLRKK